ncbi:MAG: hypothetical protein WAO08_14850 [Hyphomicrobiaceae bacterium]
MQHGDPKALSDEELGGICASSAIESASVGLGCLASIVVVLVLFFGQLAFGEVALPFAGVLALLPAALLLTHHVVSRPKRPYREELAYRSGKGPFSQYVAEAEAILRQHGADWVFVFTVRALPHGGFWWLQVVLNEGPPASARADLRVCLEGKLPIGTRVERDVPDDMVHDLLTFLNCLDLAALTDVPSVVKDGAPCHVAVLRREPRCVISASCNLGGWTAEPLQHPTAAVCSKLCDVARRLSPEC